MFSYNLLLYFYLVNIVVIVSCFYASFPSFSPCASPVFSSLMHRLFDYFNFFSLPAFSAKFRVQNAMVDLYNHRSAKNLAFLLKTYSFGLYLQPIASLIMIVRGVIRFGYNNSLHLSRQM